MGGDAVDRPDILSCLRSTPLLAPTMMVDIGDDVDLVGRAREGEEPSKC
jgi:hypothetical protein